MLAKSCCCLRLVLGIQGEALWLCSNALRDVVFINRVEPLSVILRHSLCDALRVLSLIYLHLCHLLNRLSVGSQPKLHAIHSCGILVNQELFYLCHLESALQPLKKAVLRWYRSTDLTWLDLMSLSTSLFRLKGLIPCCCVVFVT